MKKNITLSVVFALSSLFLLNSCTKEDKEVDNETQSAVDNAVCEQQFMAITPVVNEKGINEAGIKKIAASCGTWTILGAISGTNTANVATDTIVDANGFYQNGPVTFEIDYGTTTGCLSFDSVSTRYGVIRITTAKRWNSYNNPVTIDLLNYKINNINYSAQIIINRLDSVTVTMQVNNGHCTNGTWNIDYTGTKVIKQIAGYSTKNNEADDVISIDGNSSGKNREGRNFTTDITSPLIKKSTCKFFTSGTVDVTPDGFKTRIIDFGSGECDNQATYTVNGQTISFNL